MLGKGIEKIIRKNDFEDDKPLFTLKWNEYWKFNPFFKKRRCEGWSSTPLQMILSIRSDVISSSTRNIHSLLGVPFSHGKWTCSTCARGLTAKEKNKEYAREGARPLYAYTLFEHRTPSSLSGLHPSGILNPFSIYFSLFFNFKIA